ncbi:MAG: sialidase family protein [Verrucomicrobia bacterium]|nr:sialidase family protein [Verrucomicrobiota bacterium]
MDPQIKAPVTVMRMAATDRVYVGHPTVLALPGGRILAAVDLQGPDVKSLAGTKSRFADTSHWLQGRLFVSQDEGATWSQKMDFPFGHPCLFRDGNQLYLLGHRGRLMIMRSADGGETWSKPVELVPKGGDTAVYSYAPCSVLKADGHFSVALLRTNGSDHRRITPDTLAPVLLRAPEGFNLTVSKSWTWSETGPTFANSETEPAPGLPMFESTPASPAAPASARPPTVPPPGWTYPHVVTIPDARHAWHDHAGSLAHLIFSVPSPKGNAAVIARYRADADGTTRASGRPLWFSLPGGQRRFHMVWDPESRQYWLLSTHARGSLLQQHPAPGASSSAASARPQLLQLSYADNLVDWSHAAWIAGSPADPLTDPAMDVRGRDLCVVACARDADDPSVRHTKRLVFGLVRDFRGLLCGTT